MADEEVLLDSDLEAVEPAQPKGRNWLKLLSVALVVAAVGVIGVSALPKASVPLSPDTVELFGATMTNDALEKYDQFRMRHAFSYVIYFLKGGKIETTTVGHWIRGQDPSVTVKEFVDKLPADLPRYAVLHLKNDVIFIDWSPDTASTRVKMMYGASTSKMKSSIYGLDTSVTAHEKSDLTLEKLSKLVERR